MNKYLKIALYGIAVAVVINILISIIGVIGIFSAPLVEPFASIY